MAVEIDGTSKSLLGAFAVFTLGSGIASLIYGVLLLLKNISVEYNYGNFNLFSISILLIVVGGLLIITVILGVIGALKDLSNLRVVTLIVLFILFAILAAVGIWGMVSFKTPRLQKSIETDLESFSGKYDELPNDFKKKVDYLHRQYNCCTVNTQPITVGIPESCKQQPDQSYNSPKYFEKDCASVYFDTKSKTVFHLAVLTLAAAGLVLLALVLYAVVSHRARSGYAAVNTRA